MDSFLTFMDTYRGGLLVLFLCFGATVLLIQWVAWIFSWGRFNAPKVDASKLRFVMADLLVKIINDFRHMLALVMVIIFALALAYTIFRAGTDLDGITKALQAVVATLGGLVGSILGYYFGESAARKTISEEAGREREPEEPAQVGEPSEEEKPPRRAPSPPTTTIPDN